MSEHLEEFVEVLREARAGQIAIYGDDVAEGKCGWYMLQVLQQELGEVARAAISGTSEHTKVAVADDIKAVQEKLANLGAAVAATWEVLQRDRDAFCDPETDMVVVPRAKTTPSDINAR